MIKQFLTKLTQPRVVFDGFVEKEDAYLDVVLVSGQTARVMIPGIVKIGFIGETSNITLVREDGIDRLPRIKHKGTQLQILMNEMYLESNIPLGSGPASARFLFANSIIAITSQYRVTERMAVTVTLRPLWLNRPEIIVNSSNSLDDVVVFQANNGIFSRYDRSAIVNE